MASTPTETLTEGNAGRYRTESKLLSEGNPSVHQLQLQPVHRENKGDPFKYRFGKESPAHNVKTIMFLGATGSGKTTLINAMVNYILGVEWEDDFRYKLIHEDTNRSQAESQTSEVTAYELSHREGFRVPYSLVIIDTPGFGDTGGLRQDTRITEQIREFFASPHGVDQIDGICFVAQAALARLTETQKHIFNSILSIFGKDIAENIRILVTFADRGLPSVLEAINKAKIPCPKAKGRPIHFKFNNYDLFSQTGTSEDCDDEDSFDPMNWKMGSTNANKFFAALSNMTPKSLRLTKEVLWERKQLDVTVRGLQPQMRVALMKLEEIRKTQRELDRHKDDVEKNRNFEYETTEPKIEIKDITSTGTQARNCQKCFMTCENPCGCSDWWKYFCAAMDGWGNCTVCPGKCASRHHQRQNYTFDNITVTEKKTYRDVKAKYETACGEQLTQEKLKQKLEEEFVQIQCKVQELVDTISRCLARLDEIALNPNPLSTPDYIELMIVTEKQEAKPGFLERIESLGDIKKIAELVAKVAKRETLKPEESEKYDRLQQIKQDQEKKGHNWFRSWCSGGEGTPTPPGAAKQ
uniref:Septin-type G domain-containing protein n=1 Tax=Callorhinchus milii TaxID=7868 RepID=V9KHA1_CALMI